MADSTPVPQWHRSIFVRLMAIMLAMGVLIPLTVGGFIVLIVRPTLNGSAQALMAEYMDLFAAGAPDLETAKRAGERHHFGLRYQGPRGSWSTAASLPLTTPQQHLRSGWQSVLAGSGRYVVTNADGTYLFVWQYGEVLDRAHDRMIIALLALLITIVWVGHLLLRRALTPLRWLQEGVTRLGAGDLTVTVPSRTRDELGVLTDAFNQMVARVRDMIGSRDQLLLDVSHELRSPLTRMKVALALCPDSPHHQSLATNIAEMEAMIDELLELERLRQGRGLRLEPHDLVAIAHEAVAAFAGQFPGVTLGDAPAQARVTVDADRVRSVLRNLLDNAAKYALPDSQPTRISIDEREQSCIVCIEDDGPGIPEQDRTGLFEPFFRADRSRSRKTGGYGLGLSLCKRIMDAHGGSITVRPSHGRGTTFVLTFVKRKKGNR